MDSSEPCHDRGGSGMPAKDEVEIGGGMVRPGSGKAMTDGGGSPRCGVPIFSEALADGSEGKAS